LCWTIGTGTQSFEWMTPIAVSLCSKIHFNAAVCNVVRLAWDAWMCVCCRLSYHQRVSEIVPADFSKLVPVKPSPHYKYDRDGLY